MYVASKDISNGSNAPLVTVLLIVNTSSVSGPGRFIKAGPKTDVIRRQQLL